ncbi:MAG: transglutaminase-like cysteine peptidase [Deltaproteobacteria bacterium]|nr:transglutaminase-like cysteine peptidase [Deltaproteobacteria bacterium]
MRISEPRPADPLGPSETLLAPAKSAELARGLRPITNSELPRSNGVTPRGAIRDAMGHPLAVAAVMIGAAAGLVEPAQAATLADVAAPPSAPDGAVAKGSYVSGGKLTLPADVVGRALTEEGAVGVTRLDKWEQLVNDPAHRNLPERQKVDLVNRFVNRYVAYTRESIDHWNGPIQTLSSGAGDCEDYALAKYATLRLLGVPADHLGIGVGKTKSTHEGHAVLLWREPGHEMKIIDNRHDLVQSEKDADFKALILEFNEVTASLHTASGGQISVPKLLSINGKVASSLALAAPVLPP